MKTQHSLLPLLIALTLAACDGGDEASDDTTGETPGTTGDIDPSAGTTPAVTTAGSGESGNDVDPPEGTTTGDPETSETGSETSAETGIPEDTDDPTGADACGEPGVPCEDEMILDLGLVSGTVSSDAVSNTSDAGTWLSNVDATAGGIVEAPNNPWVYLRFTDEGLEQVEIDDLEALASEQWHIAAKRFGIRINSGSSGPGCVTVAPLPDAAFETVDALPDDATLRSEAFYDASCTLIDDGSGAGGANYALSQWWFYPGCVGVTYVPFVLELDDGRHVKFMVDSYYESGQAECNEAGSMGSGSANFTWRWAFLD